MLCLWQMLVVMVYVFYVWVPMETWSSLHMCSDWLEFNVGSHVVGVI